MVLRRLEFFDDSLMIVFPLYFFEWLHDVLSNIIFCLILPGICNVRRNHDNVSLSLLGAPCKTIDFYLISEKIPSRLPCMIFDSTA